MRSKFLFSVLALLAICTNGFAQIAQKDFLKVSTGASNEIWNVSTPKSTWHIVNTNGERVYLRGVNAGGWLVHEPWMTPVNANAHDQVTIMNQLKSRFGAAKRDELIAIYEDNYWTETDFNNCAAMGMSVIRLPFTYMNLVYVDDGANRHTLKPDAFKRFDWFVENCQKRGMYVILDMHGAFGSQNGQDHSGEVNGGWELYTAANAAYNQEKTVWLWGEIAKHYKDNPTVAMYDILNEPGPKAGVTNKTQWDVYDKIYKEIRKYDPEHIICMESCWGTGNLPKTTQYGWTNVVYQYHHYSWDNVSDEQGQKDFYTARVSEVRSANHGNPTFIGEFTCFGLRGAWDFALTTYNDAGWHYTSWTYKVKNNSSWGIYNHTPGDVNVFNDSEQQIRDKWGKVATSNGWANTMVRDEIIKKMPGTIGGGNPFTTANLALNKNINASSEESGNVGSFPANNANDGSASSRWASVHSDQAQWIKVDLQDSYILNGIRLLWEAAFAVGYKVEVSTDNVAWTTVKDETSGTGGVNNIEVSDILARYVRVTATQRATINGQQYGYSLYEFEVYGKKATVINVPGTFNSLDYSKKSGEIKDNNDQYGKYAGNLENGSSLEYLIDVAQSGQYDLSVRAAVGGTNAQERTISIFTGTTRLGTLSVSNGNDWFAFTPVKTNISLSNGQQTLRIVSTGAVNIENITVSVTDTSAILEIPQSGVFVYNGSAHTPSVTSVVVNGATLSQADYDVSYLNNTNAGTATVKITGKGSYADLNITRSFTIVKKDLFIALDPKEFTISLGGTVPDFSNYVTFVGFVGGDNEEKVIHCGTLDIVFQKSEIVVSCGYLQSQYVGDYRLQLSAKSELSADNYNIIFDDASLRLIVEDPTPIKAKQVRSDKFGILLETNPIVSDFAKILVKTPKMTQINLVVYDNTGNVVFNSECAVRNSESAAIVWDLTNSVGRIVANGSYLLVVEAKDASGKVYNYSTKLGVKRNI
ncbi:MAG: cellulase family glycosylhydrolase [Chitinispirillales bacterium]|jgi:aryl-phospho-beta-D-glucosidase BglC (GH1 family)|nr:cellulase family glycosylhydrolase [Chitinispirillales bacterium]